MDVLAFTFSAANIGSILLAAFGLGLVIFIHELGHFAVAKWCGVKVERFSIGFGPALWKHTRGETEYVLAALPLGGFVKMLGQDDADPGQMTDQQVAKDPRSYTAKSVPQRIAIISAGVINNMVSAVLFFIIAFMLGVKYQPAVIGSVTPGSPAWEADLSIGTRINQVDDRKDEKMGFTDVRLPVALSHTDQELQISGYRDGKSFTTRVRPVLVEGQLVPTIGAEPMQSLTLQDPKEEKDKDKITSPGLSASRTSPPFEPGDTIVEINSKPVKDYSEMARELAIHRSEIVEFGVRRKGAEKASPLTKITVEPNHFQTLGLKMAIGQISAIRRGSPAEGKLKPGDTITNILAPDAKAVGMEIDPLQLPDYFSDHAGQEVQVRVKRKVTGGNPAFEDISLVPETRPAWMDRPTLGVKDCPLTIPAIGIAFHVLHHVVDVVPGSPAARAGIRPQDNLQAIDLLIPKAEKKAAGKDPDIKFDKDNRNWPATFWLMQDAHDWKFLITLKSPKGDRPVKVVMEPEAVADWYLPIRGIAMQPQSETRKAANVGEATTLGFRRTRDSLIEMWLTIRGLFSQRISVRALGGPIRIAETAFFSSQQGVPDLILFLGILSVSLAVLNFLPIPVLDGGHFVFLCWEGIRGKPPSERVVVTATYLGLTFILSLMAFVFYIDISSLFGGK